MKEKEIMNGEIKVIEFEGFSVELIARFKDDETDVFRKGRKIIESCITPDQLDTAIKFIDLLNKYYIGVASALYYLAEDKRIDIKEAMEDLNKLNVIYEDVISDKK